MMNLRGKIIGILVASGFDDSQVAKVAQVLRQRGAKVLAVGVQDTEAVAVTGRHGSLLRPDTVLAKVTALDLDAVVIPGGESTMRIKLDERVMTLLLELCSQEKPIGAMCNAVTVLAAAGLTAGRRVTGAAATRRQLDEAGATFLDQSVAVDHNLVTSRAPEDVTHFIDAISILLEPAPSLR